MNLDEWQAKALLATYGLTIPRGVVVSSSEEAREQADLLGRVVVKAQVPAGKRAKSGAILFANDSGAAAAATESLLGVQVNGFRVERILIEERIEVERELYAAIVNDSRSKSPLLLFSSEGGTDIEKVATRAPTRLVRQVIDIRTGLNERSVAEVLEASGLEPRWRATMTANLLLLYQAYRGLDAELLEVNPLALDRADNVVVIDCKLAIDDAALPRHPELAELVAGRTFPGTELERRAREQGLLYIELDGDIGIIANGAGLTMTTMDMVTLNGGHPANFLEIGGANYTRAAPALAIVLGNPRLRTLLVNFCGAFARADTMTQGLLEALDELRFEKSIHFCVRGTGEAEALAMLRDRGIEPHETMDHAVRAAIVDAARGRMALGTEVAN